MSGDTKLTSDSRVAGLRGYAEMMIAEDTVHVSPRILLALVECAERLRLVDAADEKAIADLKNTYGVEVDRSADSFELMAGNKAALAKLEAL